MRGVLGSRRTERHYAIIARALAFGSQSALGNPDERVEPVERADESSRKLAQRIVPRYVRELVTEHDFSVFLRPIGRVLGQKNHGRQRAPGKRSADNRAREKSHLACYASLRSPLTYNFLPVSAR